MSPVQTFRLTLPGLPEPCGDFCCPRSFQRSLRKRCPPAKQAPLLARACPALHRDQANESQPNSPASPPLKPAFPPSATRVLLTHHTTAGSLPQGAVLQSDRPSRLPHPRSAGASRGRERRRLALSDNASPSATAKAPSCRPNTTCFDGCNWSGCDSNGTPIPSTLAYCSMAYVIPVSARRERARSPRRSRQTPGTEAPTRPRRQPRAPKAPAIHPRGRDQRSVRC